MWNADSIPVSEDCVEYHLYPSVKIGLEELVTLRDLCWQCVESHIKEHIWHDQQFILEISDPSQTSHTYENETRDEERLHIWGSTRFGENLEDEWFIVHLLRTISKHFNNLIISMTDQDGQFLLIEAAMNIPKWLKPTNSDNRVWLYNNEWHIIPIAKTPQQLTLLPSGDALQLQTALDIITLQPVPTKAERNISDTLTKRVDETVKCLKDGTSSSSPHYGMCYLPPYVAYLIYKHPQLISTIVNTYYHRDPIQMRVCRAMKKFKFTSPILQEDTNNNNHNNNNNTNNNNNILLNGCSYFAIKFTRCLYAMLVRQQLDFVPHGYPSLPNNNTSSKKVQQNNSQQPQPQKQQQQNTTTTTTTNEPQNEKAMTLGYMIVSALEIYYSESIKKKKRTKNNQPPTSSSSSSTTTTLIGCEIIDSTLDPVLQSINPVEIERAVSYLNSENDKAKKLLTSDDWLNISPEELEDVLTKKQSELDKMMNTKKNKPLNDMDIEDEGREDEEEDVERHLRDDDDDDKQGNDKLPPDNIFDSMVKDMKKFFSQMSDFEGVEPEDDDEDDDPDYKPSRNNNDDDDESEEDEGFYDVGEEDEDEEDIGYVFVI
eukprot:TRINITY_DN873_c0_g1_i1.p1 TRINITY_DN873_c0_g1~~TRINITY_DN873_c0_g1_i1.p1  ORF type:complete len:600 (+),score=203.61 TRINITY_DN873_c0_g1_i1:50-1849(+)